MNNLILIKEVIVIPMIMRTIMYINFYLILARKISNQIIIKTKIPMIKDIIFIKIPKFIGTRGSITTMIRIILIQEVIIIAKEIIIIKKLGVDLEV